MAIDDKILLTSAFRKALFHVQYNKKRESVHCNRCDSGGQKPRISVQEKQRRKVSNNGRRFVFLFGTLHALFLN